MLATKPGFNVEIPAQRQRTITSAVAAVLAIVAALSLAQRLRAASGRFNEEDFVTNYGWWVDYSSGGDPWVVRKKQVDLRPGLARPIDCNYPPFFVEIFSPLARLDQRTAFWTWQAALLLCVVIAVLMLARGCDPPLGTAPTIIVLSLVLVSRQLAGIVAYSKVTPMLLALLSASWFCARRERPQLAGLWLALAALLKLYPAAAGGYFLFGRRWRALGWTIGFFAAGVLLTNPARWIEFMKLGVPVSYQLGARADLTVFLFARKTVAHFGAPLYAVLATTVLIDLTLLAIAAAATIGSRRRGDLDGLLFGLWVALALLMSPLAWVAETLLLVPLYLFGLRAAWQRFRAGQATRRLDLLAGGAILAICVLPGLIKAVPHPEFPTLLGAYVGAALILRAGMRARPDGRKA